MLDHINEQDLGALSKERRPHSLLDLPTEITSIIWRHALVLPVPIQIYCHPDTQSVAFESGEHDPDAQIRLRSKTIELPVSLLATCRRVYHEAASLLYDENLFEYNPLNSRFPPLGPKDFAILPKERIFSLDKISISTPWFDAMTLNLYKNLHTIIFRYPGDIFLARRDLPSRDHPRTIRPLDFESEFPKEGTNGDDDDDDAVPRYYESLSEVDHNALIAYSERDYQHNSSFYDTRAVMCRGISSSVEVLISFNLRHLDDSSPRPAGLRNREVLIPAGKILQLDRLGPEDRVATREEVLAQGNLWGGLSTLIVP